jgi:hypothetical protein
MVSSLFNYKSRLYASGVVLFAIGLYSLLMSIPLDNSEAQNLTNQTAGNMQTISITNEVPIPLDCDAVGLGNTSSSAVSNISSTDAVIDIRCNLEEARHAVAADAADSALQQINEADNMIVAVFGNGSSTNGSSNVSSVGNNTTR